MVLNPVRPALAVDDHKLLKSHCSNGPLTLPRKIDFFFIPMRSGYFLTFKNGSIRRCSSCPAHIHCSSCPAHIHFCCSKWGIAWSCMSEVMLLYHFIHRNEQTSQMPQQLQGELNWQRCPDCVVDSPLGMPFRTCLKWEGRGCCLKPDHFLTSWSYT